jgi:hypothetical protein
MEKQESAALARRLCASGVPLSVDDAWQQNILRMRQIGRPSDSRAFDLGTGATGYIINVNIQIDSSNLSISDIYLELPWEDLSISLLPDPVGIAAGYRDYRFYGKKFSFIEIGRTEVLNHELIRPKLFRSGTKFQGSVLWSGMASIPNAFVHGGISPARVIIFDQFDESYAFQVSLWIDRRHKWSPKKHDRNSRPSLFSQRDFSPVYSRSEVDTVEVAVANK